MVAFLAVAFTAIILTIAIRELVIKKDENGLSKLDAALGVEPDTSIRGDYSLQQAYSQCRQRVKGETEVRIKTIVFDARASRFIPDKGVHQVFMNVDLDRKGKAMSLYARCDVSSVNNQIVEYRLNSEESLFGLW